MKKHMGIYKKCLAGLLTASLTVSLITFPASAGDTWPFKQESAHGINQPSVHGYTSGQIAKWSPETDPDAEFLKSHIPLQKRIDAFPATQANPDLSTDVKMLNLSGDYGNAFIENAPYTNKFAQYHFNFWQYTDYFSPWHGTATAYTPREYYDDTAQKDWTQKWFEFGMLNIPNPAYTDAAHKNGVLSLAGIFFSNSDRGQQTYKQMLLKDENGKFIVAEKMVEMARYFGYDGYFFNQEESGPDVTPADIPDYMAFLKVFQKASLYVQWYDAVNASTGANSFTRQIGNSNVGWLYDRANGEPVTNSFFFDYGVGSTQINNTNNYLNNLNSTYGTTYTIFDTGFAGLEAGRDRWENTLTKKLSGGLPAVSIATLGADFVHAGLDEDMPSPNAWPQNRRAENEYQWMTAVRERLWWSGPNQDPKNTTVSATNTVSDVYAKNQSWTGIASVIAERSVIGGSNFYTNFNTGHGLNYYVHGQVSNNDEWSNMSQQDIPVTWQWWQDTTGNKLEVDFDYGSEYTMTGNTQNRFSYQKMGGYNGGSSLVVNGSLNAENYLRLYKTDIDINAGSKLSIAFNKPSDNDPSGMSVGLVFKDDPNNVVKVPVSDTGNKTSGWKDIELDLSAYAGKKVAVLGLVFENGGSTISNYQMNIGQIRIYDGSAVEPAAPTGLKIANSFANTDEMCLKWDMDTDYSIVKQYNIYVNNIYVGGKYDNIFYIKKLPARSGTIKVAAVGADGLEGDTASISFDLDKAVSRIVVDSKEDGSFNISWTKPADSSATGDITVKLRSINLPTDKIIEKEVTVPAGGSSVSMTGMPVNGDDYILDIAVGTNSAVSLSGNFIDRVCEPYAESWSLNGTTLNLPMPNTRDWRYMYVYEDGIPKQFATTYNQGNKPMIIRGRSTKACLSFESTANTVSVVMEDYAGNKSDKVLVKTTPLSAKHFPDPVLLQWVSEHVGSDLSSVMDFHGTLDLSGLEISDLTGVNLFANVGSLDVSSTKIKLLDENMLPPNVASVKVSNCEELAYICEAAFNDRKSLKTLDITGCGKLKLLRLNGSAIYNLIYGDKTAFPDLISMDLSNTPLNMKTGTPARILADYIKTQVIEGQNVVFDKSGVISTVKNGIPVISASSFYDSESLFDGIISDTNYGYCYSTGGNVTVDFRKDVAIDGFTLTSMTGYLAKNFEVYTSEDGVEFVKTGDTVTNNTLKSYDITFPSPVTARYFRIQILSSTGSSYITELQVKGIMQVSYPSGVIFKGSDGLSAVSFSPENGINDVGLYEPLRIIFSDKVTSGTGNIIIYNEDDSVFQSIPANSKETIFYQDTATIRHDKFELGKSYYVLIDESAFKDVSGVPYAGIKEKTGWSFTATEVPDRVAPSEVSRTAVSARDQQLVVAWSDPTDPDFDHVIVTGSAISVQQIEKGVQKAVITNLNNGRNYDILLKTVDMDGNESEGLTVSGIPTAEPDITAPGEVEGAIVSAGDGQLTITWSDPADADFDYVVVTGAGITAQNISKGIRQAEISGLENGTKYNIVLQTVDTDGNVSAGVIVSGIPAQGDITPPAEVAGTAISAGNGQVVITWIDPADADFDHVIVTGSGFAAQNIAKGVQNAVITGLTNGVNYSILVKTVDRTGNESAGVRLSGAPAAPGGSSEQSGSSESSFGSSTPSVSADVREKVKVVGSSIVIVEKPKLDSVTGVVQTADVTSEFIQKALNNSKEDNHGVKHLKLEIPKVEGATGYAARIDASLLASQQKNVGLEIITNYGSINLMSDMLSNLEKNTGMVEIVIKSSDAKELEQTRKSQIGSRPVVELYVKIDGKPVKWENINSPVVVEIPYKPSADELNRPEHIVILYIDDARVVTPVPNARYDATAGTVKFTSDHFSKYAVAYVNKTFSDVRQDFWGRNAIEVLASRGVLEGTTDDIFSPNKNVTRGEFIMWLVKSLGINTYVDSNFTDVRDTDRYYREIAIARKLGITSGVGNNKYNPEAEISRQDMMVLTVKAMKVNGINTETGTPDALGNFADNSSVSKYALEDVTTMVNSQLVAGYDGKLNPKSNITRAEVAQILYNIYSKF